MTNPLTLSDAVDYLLQQAQKNGADGAESFGVDSLSISTECRFQKTETIEQSHSSGVDLRVFCGKKQACVSSSILEMSTLKELAERAVQMAKLVPDDPYCGLAEPEQQASSFKELDLYDKTEYSTQDLFDLALKAEDAALSVEGVSSSEGAGAGLEKTSVIMSSTTGFHRQYQRSNASFSVSVIAEDSDKNKEVDYDFSSAVYFSDLEDAEEIGRNAGQRAVKKLGSEKINSDRMDVVLEPRLARGLVGTIASAINGASIARETSFLKDCMGEEILPNTLSLIENPHKKRALGSRASDSEGLPTIERALIENGVLKTWLLDLHSARKLGLTPTGHGARGLGGTPYPTVSNLTLEGGVVSAEELRSDIKRGLYITQLFGSGVNLITGDYSRGASGFLIENGEITTPVSEITLAGNLKDMLKNMVVANDLTQRFSVNAPSIRLFNMSVAGK